MARPWEEEWIVEQRQWGTMFGVAGESVEDRARNHEARVTLAAAAPDMARLLLELEWSGGYGDDGGTIRCCPDCGADEPSTIHFPAKRVDAYTRVEAHDKVVGGKHKEDCKLVAVLTKAGVLPRHSEGRDK